MKNLLILLLLPLYCSAQTKDYIVLTQDTSFIIKLKAPTHVVAEEILFTTAVISNALGDGLNSRQYYAHGHALNALSVGCLLSYPFVSPVTWKTPVTYILIRYALFDLFYNIGAHRDLNYRGGQNYYNQGVGHIPLGALNASKAVSFVLAIYINIK